MVHMAKIIRGADTADKTVTPESIGVEALLDASRPLLDALYAYCKQKVANA